MEARQRPAEEAGDGTVVLLAGEVSGDAYGGALAEELARRAPDLRLVGTGGQRMRAAGVELVAELHQLAVMGFAEVLPRLGFFLRLERRLHRLLDDARVELVVPIDYPGLNLRVSREAHRRGIPVLYYVAPQVWAWRERRARALAEYTRHVAVILPFERDFLERFGVRATFVGHPLLDRDDDLPDRRAFHETWRLDPDRTLLALLPGSRRQEVSRHLALFIEAAEILRTARPDVLPVVGRAPTLGAALFGGVPFPVVDDVRSLLRYARAALLKSGTVTLEAALEETPSVVAYRTSAATWALASRLVRVEHVALPNLILDARAVPEYLQRQATPAALAAALLPLLDTESVERRRQAAALGRVRSAVGSPGAAARVADLALALLGSSR